ncbi:unnamed protein product [Protopolystoma xenopodis]|uniref:Uncharacterized protein n=1 Tax=Protopolystoma xenopodis TaxID=117903 RepID=A0A448WLB7_9PLAT|nr:unnamed protein product [Protopolystoma xenopodis]
MAKLTYDAGETSGNVPCPRSDFGNDEDSLKSTVGVLCADNVYHDGTDESPLTNRQSQRLRGGRFTKFCLTFSLFDEFLHCQPLQPQDLEQEAPEGVWQDSVRVKL